MKLSNNLGMLLLGIWLILTGLLPLLNLNFPAVALSSLYSLSRLGF